MRLSQIRPVRHHVILASVEGELSRPDEACAEPGVKDLWRAIDGHVVDAVPGTPATPGHGKAWAYIDISMKLLQRVKSLREPHADALADAEYQVRKKEPRKAKAAVDTPR